MQKKCVRAGDKGKGKQMGKGDGMGPLGVPQEEMFAMDTPELEKIKKVVDILVDAAVAECGDTNSMQNEPSEEPEEELSRAHKDIAGYADPDDIEDEYPPGEQDDDLHQIEDPVPEENMYGHGGLGMGERMQLEFLLSEEDYKEFFRAMMDKFGITGLKGLSVEKKKEFFSQVGAAWRSKKEGGIDGKDK